MIAVDTNILIYAHRDTFSQHGRALKALTALADGTELWAIPSVCLAEFLRVTTHPRVLQPPSTMAQATGALEAQIVALCVEHGVRERLTADRDFARFSDIKTRTL